MKIEVVVLGDDYSTYNDAKKDGAVHDCFCEKEDLQAVVNGIKAASQCIGSYPSIIWREDGSEQWNKIENRDIHSKKIEFNSVRDKWGMACPECKDDKLIYIKLNAAYHLNPQGYNDDSYNLEWESKTDCECGNCGFDGTVRDFDIKASDK